MFDSETKLVESFIDVNDSFLSLILENQYELHNVITEYNSNQFGIADIVFGATNNICTNRIKIKPEYIVPINKLELNKNYYENEFLELTRLKQGDVKKYLDYYLKNNWLVESDDNSYMKIVDYQKPIEKIISIEAKLYNWKKALLQALRYRLFSELVFVLLDNDFVHRATKNLDLFKDKNIGLISLDSKKHIHIHYMPDKEFINNSYYYYQANEFIYEDLMSSYSSKKGIPAC